MECNSGRMLNKSIAYRLSIYVSLAVIFVFLIFIVIAYFFNIRILRENIENQAMALAYKAVNSGEKQLVTTREVTTEMAADMVLLKDGLELERIVRNVMGKHQFLNAVHIRLDSAQLAPDNLYYFIFRDNDSLIFNRGNSAFCTCIKERNIFQEAEINEKPGWTSIFNCERNNSDVVSFYAPIKKYDNQGNSSIVGSVITELKLNEINDSINQLRPGKSGYAVLVSKDGTYLSHPDKQKILNQNILQFSKKEYKGTPDKIKEVLEKGGTGSVIGYPKYLDYAKCWIYYTQIKETGWMLIFVVPYDELFVSFYLLILRMLFFSVIGVLVIFLLVTYITNKQIQPLNAVTTQLKKFSSVSGELELNTSNEVELVSASLDYLRDWYDRFKINRHEEEKLNTQRIRDLKEASEIQMGLINVDFKEITNKNDIDIYAIYKPMRIVSGDLYDFFMIDNENLYFSIGDVSGKGVSAAFFMSVAQTLLKNNARFNSPSKIAFNTNNDLFTNNQHQFYLTLFAGILNIKTGLLKFCNAAHTASMILGQKGEIKDLNQIHGMPLGLYANRDFAEDSIQLFPEDSIVLFSDGVTEQQNIDKVHYGIERFSDCLRKNRGLTAKEIIHEVEKDLQIFSADTTQSDDITLMIIKYLPEK